MKEKTSIFWINILKKTIEVYFDTFFVVYFLSVANYEVIPLAKYYIAVYLFIGVGFFLLRNVMKQNIKVPYYQIGISLQALYVASIMILKDKIITFSIFIGALRGLADGFYHYPKNLLNTEKIDNNDRQKFNGLYSIFSQIISIILPLLMGILLTFFNYVTLAKIFFIFFIIIFILSFNLKDAVHYLDRKFDWDGFKKLIKKNKKIRYSLLIPFLSGLTYSSGVMDIVIKLFNINQFKTNLNLGIVDSICAGLSLLVCILFTTLIKKEDFSFASKVSGILFASSLLIFSFWTNKYMLIVYLLLRYSFVKFISLIEDVTIDNFSNCKELKSKYKTEFYLARDVLFSITRTLGYIILLFVSILFGSQYIQYVLIICALAFLIESFILAKVNE